jgi:serine beta-lactamase-like protein LACTB, mitochondrial
MKPISRSRRLLLSLSLAALFAGAAPPSSQPAAPVAGTPTERARAFAEELRLKTGSPGLSAAVAVDGRVVWREGFGLADVENRVPVWPESKFRIGSLSKLITAAAVARLVEAGKLDLDAPIQRYVPSFPDKGALITPRLLAGHLAGIRHYVAADFQRPLKSYEHLADALEIFAKDPLVAPPGSKYAYSSYGFNLLGIAVESAAGTDFLTAVDDLVLRPLDLRNTMADRPAAIVERRVRFYARDGEGALRNERPIDSSSKWPSGGFLSTAPDLVRFASAHLDGSTFLRPETRALLFTSQRTTAGEETGVGIAWRIGRDAQGRRILHHGGAIEGGRAFLLLYPDQKVAVALLANLTFARFDENEAEKLAEMFIH